jgi:hypothetical protein
MKYLIFITLILSLSNTIWGQSNTAITEESKTNQALLDNSAAAKKILDSQNNNAPPTSINIFGNKASSTTTTSSANLTDQEKQLSENYIDQAKANRIYKEKCVGEMAQACRGNEVDHKIMGMDPIMIKLASQAYATIGALGDFLPLSNKVATDQTTTTTSNSSAGNAANAANAGNAGKAGTSGGK